MNGTKRARVSRWGKQIEIVRKPGVLMWIRGGALHYSKIRIFKNDEVVDDAEVAIRRLLNGEKVWVFELARLITTIQRRLEQVLAEPVAGD